jgi:hypothetical protein
VTVFKISARLCDTCIYRPDSPLSLAKLENDVRDPFMPGFFRGHRVCHHSPARMPLCCRGFWEAHKDAFTLGQIAQRMRWLEFVEPTKGKVK